MKPLLTQPEIANFLMHEYLLVLKPTASINDKILSIKESFAEKFNAPDAKYYYPHITLANFLQFKMLENKLVHRLNILAMGYHQFTVNLNGYGSFPSHTIFINIESKQQIQTLVRELRQARRLMTLNNKNQPHLIEEPNLTVARKLLPLQYEQAWKEYSHKHFAARFIAESMSLLRRPIAIKGDGIIAKGKYQKVTQFKFMNLPVSTKQGSLFA